MKRFAKPNFKRSNLNISATLAEFLGAPNKNATLSRLKKELEKDYKNIVFICFDGLGINPIKLNLEKKSFLRKNIKMVLTSTFPATTTNATTSLSCNKLPLEHGWFGWSLYFDEIKQNIDIYRQTNSQTGEFVDFRLPLADNSDCYFDHANTDFEITPILPSFVQTKHDNKKIIIENETELCNSIRQVCAREGKQFIYSYLPEPDATMHRFGVASMEAKEKINSINKLIENLYNDLDNTLIIITADHGQSNVEGYVEFYKDKELNKMLIHTPFLDARTPAFIVKKGKEKVFENLFRKRYGKDFKLVKSADLIKKGYFGTRGNFGHLLGDYIAIGTYTHKQFLPSENSTRFKGHHTSLTEEMKIPLILCTKN